MPGAGNLNRFETVTINCDLKLKTLRSACSRIDLIPDPIPHYNFHFLLFIQAYESLHGLLEISDADKKAALLRISQLEQERMRVYEYAINEGLQLPSSLCADND